jgi:hypothetical protein
MCCNRLIDQKATKESLVASCRGQKLIIPDADQQRRLTKSRAARVGKWGQQIALQGASGSYAQATCLFWPAQVFLENKPQGLQS